MASTSGLTAEWGEAMNRRYETAFSKLIAPHRHLASVCRSTILRNKPAAMLRAQLHAKAS
jgi:hypothetical protein